MPKEYQHCVDSYVKKGTPLKKAKAICAAAYYKKHKMTVTQAHARGVEESEGDMTVALKERDTHEYAQRRIREALRDRYGFPGDDSSVPYSAPYLVDTSDELAVVEWQGRLFAVDYALTSSGEVELGEVQELQRAYITAEQIASAQQVMAEGWLPPGVTQTDLDDGDFAWLSFEYQRASTDDRAKMNKRRHRKLPYKVRGKVDREGWKAAWRAIAWTTYLRPSLKGGPGKEAVMAKLRAAKPRGIKLDKDNRFTDTSARKAEGSQGWKVAVRATLFNTDPILVEEGDGEGKKDFIIVGTALIDGAISNNRRYYPKEFNDAAMKATNKFMEGGGIVTIYTRHAKALPGQTGYPEGLPVGRVTEPLWRDGKKIKYKGIIVETSEGRDAQELIRKQIMPGTSVRSVKRFKSRVAKVNGKVLEVMEWAVIEGIDLTDDPGIVGAGIDSFLEETSELVSITTEEADDDMSLSELTLEELREARPDLLAEVVAPLQEKLEAYEAKPPEGPEPESKEKEPEPEPTAAPAPALEEVQGQLEKALAQVGALNLELAITRAGLQGVGKAIVEELKAKVTAEEEIPKVLPEVYARAVAAFLEESTVSSKHTTAKGESDSALEETATKKATHSPAQQEVLQFAGAKSE